MVGTVLYSTNYLYVLLLILGLYVTSYPYKLMCANFRRKHKNESAYKVCHQNLIEKSPKIRDARILSGHYRDIYCLSKNKYAVYLSLGR